MKRSDLGFSFLYDFIQKKGFKTSGHLSECRIRHVNHKTGNGSLEAYPACLCVCMQKKSKSS